MATATLNYEPMVFPPRGGQVDSLTPVQEEILALKKERNAVILAHNYQIEAIQQVADYVGDSLGLAYRAEKAEADCIVFCGVHFMAETAKIVNPGKTVLLPDLDAGCSLSDSCPAGKLAAYKEANPDVYVVAYINCSAAVKALSDVICTSGNAVNIVNRVPASREILFVPDQNLGQWVSKQAAAPCNSGPAPVTPTSFSPNKPSSASGCNSPMPSSSLTPSASKPSAITPTKSAAPRRWSPSAGTAKPITSSS